MKPTVMANAAANASAGGGHGNAPHTTGATATNGITIPINHQYGAQQPQQQQYPQQQQQPQQQYVDPSAAGYGSPSGNRQFPAHFQQGFGFEPDMDDMFSRSRLGRMHDPFAGFTTRKRCGNEPHATAADGFSHYFDDDPDFGFPQFGTLGRRRAAAAAAAAAGTPIDPHANIGHDEHDFFNRLPSEFRQYIPEGFGHTRRSAPAHPPNMTPAQSQAYYAQPQQQQHFVQPSQTPSENAGPQSPSKKLCDAAIQTEDPITTGHESEHAQTPDHLNQHGLRNTVDMGVKSMPEGEDHGMRAHSAPPNEQLQQQQQMNGKRPTPPSIGPYATQTSPQVGQQPSFQKIYYPPQQQAHPQQRQQTPPPPQTPGGTYIRTIPIFVEGRSEPIINSHKEIPNQNAGTTGATAAATSRANVPHPQQPQQQQQQQHNQSQQHYPQQQQQQHPQHHQQHRPTPLNTQQQEAATGTSANAASGVPPQTPHTLDSINKIQDIQRDVLDLMSKVERFGGRRQDKEYAYLDEMLTRNLLKLDTIDTNGKDSIRLARKEAIKCIQASINVLEAKAEENVRMAAAAMAEQEQEQGQEQPSEEDNGLRAWGGEMDVTKEAEMLPDDKNAAIPLEDAQPVDATKIQEPIPLPAPEGMQMNNEDLPPEAANTEQQQTTAASPETQEPTMSESRSE